MAFYPGFHVAAQGYRLQVCQALDLVLRILNRQHVVETGFRVDPIARGDHGVRGQGGDDVVHHFPLIKPHLAGARPIHV